MRHHTQQKLIVSQLQHSVASSSVDATAIRGAASTAERFQERQRDGSSPHLPCEAAFAPAQDLRWRVLPSASADELDYLSDGQAVEVVTVSGAGTVSSRHWEN